MRALLDSDVLIDVALKRGPFFDSALQVLQWAEDNPGQTAVAWHSLSNIAYIVRPDVRPFLGNLLEFIEVAPIETRQAKQALGFPMSDFEDALQSAAALAFDAQWIVSRNLKHFTKSPVPAISLANSLEKLEDFKLQHATVIAIHCGGGVRSYFGLLCVHFCTDIGIVSVYPLKK